MSQCGSAATRQTHRHVNSDGLLPWQHCYGVNVCFIHNNTCVMSLQERNQSHCPDSSQTLQIMNRFSLVHPHIESHYMSKSMWTPRQFIYRSQVNNYSFKTISAIISLCSSGVRCFAHVQPRASGTSEANWETFYCDIFQSSNLSYLKNENGQV